MQLFSYPAALRSPTKFSTVITRTAQNLTLNTMATANTSFTSASNQPIRAKRKISSEDVNFSFTSEADDEVDRNLNHVQGATIPDPQIPYETHLMGELIEKHKAKLTAFINHRIPPVVPLPSHNGTDLNDAIGFMKYFITLDPTYPALCGPAIETLENHTRQTKDVSSPTKPAVSQPIKNLASSPIASKTILTQQHVTAQLSTESPPIRITTKNGKRALISSPFSSSPQQQQPSSPANPTRVLMSASQSQQQSKQDQNVAATKAVDFVSPLMQPFQPAVQKRPISTSSNNNARIELSTQRPSAFANITRRSKTEAAATIDAPGQQQETTTKVVKAITLSEEQNKVIELARQGANIFYTGSAGTGKSLLLRSLIKSLKKQHPTGTVGITASTGLAACNVGGQTLHSFTGIGLGKGTADQLATKIKRNKKTKDRWINLKVLVIDEISMIDGELFDKLDAIAKKLRRNNYPFGGIQLIICGDFYQLPPVSKDKEAMFAFESESWKQSIKYTIVLKKVFRQQSDRDFINMLNEVRNGNVTPQTAKKFSALTRRLPSREGVTPAQLFATRREVERANTSQLKQLPGKEIRFKSFDGGSVQDEQFKAALLSNFLAPERIYLKKDAQVMLIKNLDETLVNGSLGKVVDFVDPDTYAFYKTNSDPSEVYSSVDIAELANSKKDSTKQLVENPEEIESDLDDHIFSFMEGISGIAGDENSELPESVVKSMERKREKMKLIRSASKGRSMPLVRFILSDGSTREVLVEPETFSIEDEFEKPLVSRTQIPLILAWSLSIHKSQGQTLPLVTIDLRYVFEKGQAYVALSRATNRRGLQVINFDPTKIKTHEKVVAFYEKLMTVDEIEVMDAAEVEATDDPNSEQFKLTNLVDSAASVDDFQELWHKEQNKKEDKLLMANAQLTEMEVMDSDDLEDMDTFHDAVNAQPLRLDFSDDDQSFEEQLFQRR